MKTIKIGRILKHNGSGYCFKVGADESEDVENLRKIVKYKLGQMGFNVEVESNINEKERK